MSSERKDTLKKRLDENYTDFIESLQEKTVSELIAMAPEITAAQQLYEELLDACDDEDMEFLLRFDDPLEVVRGYWESEITGYDHSGEMGHMLWRIREDHHLAIDKARGESSSKEAAASPVAPHTTPKPKVQLAYPGEDVYSVLHRAIKTLKEAGQQQEAAAMAFLVFSAKNSTDALAVLSNYVEIEPPRTPKNKNRPGMRKNRHER